MKKNVINDVKEWVNEIQYNLSQDEGGESIPFKSIKKVPPKKTVLKDTNVDLTDRDLFTLFNEVIGQELENGDQEVYFTGLFIVTPDPFLDEPLVSLSYRIDTPEECKFDRPTLKELKSNLYVVKKMKENHFLIQFNIDKFDEYTHLKMLEVKKDIFDSFTRPYDINLN